MEQKSKKSKEIKFEQGKVYVKKEDVWMIDFDQSREYMLVYVREQQFKVKPENLVYLESQGE